MGGEAILLLNVLISQATINTFKVRLLWYTQAWFDTNHNIEYDTIAIFFAKIKIFTNSKG